MEEIEINDI
jgi:hypothetical protein